MSSRTQLSTSHTSRASGETTPGVQTSNGAVRWRDGYSGVARWQLARSSPRMAVMHAKHSPAPAEQIPAIITIPNVKPGSELDIQAPKAAVELLGSGGLVASGTVVSLPTPIRASYSLTATYAGSLSHFGAPEAMLTQLPKKLLVKLPEAGDCNTHLPTSRESHKIHTGDMEPSTPSPVARPGPHRLPAATRWPMTPAQALEVST